MSYQILFSFKILRKLQKEKVTILFKKYTNAISFKKIPLILDKKLRKTNNIYLSSMLLV